MGRRLRLTLPAVPSATSTMRVGVPASDRIEAAAGFLLARTVRRPFGALLGARGESALRAVPR